jgi:hypothetical protein
MIGIFDVKEVLEYLAGFGVSVVVGHVAVSRLTEALWNAMRPGGAPAAGSLPVRQWLPALSGIAERSLYTTSLLLGKPEFIGIWLALKAAGQWNRWQDAEKAEQVEGRAIYHAFLIGSAASIGFGVTGFAVTVWLKDGPAGYAVAVPLLLILALEAARAFALRAARRERSSAIESLILPGETGKETGNALPVSEGVPGIDPLGIDRRPNTRSRRRYQE